MNDRIQQSKVTDVFEIWEAISPFDVFGNLGSQFRLPFWMLGKLPEKVCQGCARGV